MTDILEMKNIAPLLFGISSAYPLWAVFIVSGACVTFIPHLALISGTLKIADTVEEAEMALRR